MVPMDAIWLVVSEDVAFARHFVDTCPPPNSHPVGVLLVLAMPLKVSLKWWEIQLVIHPIVGRWIYYR